MREISHSKPNRVQAEILPTVIHPLIPNGNHKKEDNKWPENIIQTTEIQEAAQEAVQATSSGIAIPE